MLSTLFVLSSDQRQKRSLTQDVIPFLNDIKFQHTDQFSFETENRTPNSTTISLAREHCDSYLHYIWYKTLEKTPSKTAFQLIFNPVHSINRGIYYRTLHPQIKTHSLFKMFLLLIWTN